MNANRKHILEWAEQGRIHADVLPAALRLAGVTPSPEDWRRFADGLALWLGVIFLGAGVIFFLAYNWDALARFAKFGMVEVPILAAIFACFRLRLEQLSGQAALLGATLLMGALLALVGQVYQTGADTYELFAVWALAVLPWVAVGRFGALWLAWIGLLHLAVVFYYQVFGGLFGLIFNMEKLLWVLFILDSAALCVWELAARRVAWLRERWPVRFLATASGALITLLVLWAIFDFNSRGATALLAYVAWLAAVYLVYRRWVRDVFVLAGGALSAIVVVSVFLSKHLLEGNGASGYLFIGLVVIAMSAASAFWLRRVAMEDAQ